MECQLSPTEKATRKRFNFDVTHFVKGIIRDLSVFAFANDEALMILELKKDRSRSSVEVIDDIRKRVEAMVPGLIIDFGQVVGDMIGDLSTSVQPIEIKLFGDDALMLRRYSEQVAALVEKVDGTADVFSGVVISGPSVSVQPRYEAMALHAISSAGHCYYWRVRYGLAVATSSAPSH